MNISGIEQNRLAAFWRSSVQILAAAPAILTDFFLFCDFAQYSRQIRG
jgi:hypothetical protein